MGFWHEQSRPDRDIYVVVHEDNIAAGKLYNFQTRSWAEIVTLDIPYDLGSSMHYGAKVYAVIIVAIVVVFVYLRLSNATTHTTAAQ